MKRIIDKEICYSKKIELIKQPLTNFINSRVFNKEDCKDVLQNTLLILIEKQNTYDANKSFYSWAFTICRFQIKKYLTNMQRNKEDCWESFEDVGLDFNRDPYVKLINKELLNERESKLLEIKSKFLTPKELQFFCLVQEGKTRQEIMTSMGIKKINYYQYRARVAKRFLANFSTT